jgi:hypothetical protein
MAERQERTPIHCALASGGRVQFTTRAWFCSSRHASNRRKFKTMAELYCMPHPFALRPQILHRRTALSRRWQRTPGVLPRPRAAQGWWCRELLWVIQSPPLGCAIMGANGARRALPRSTIRRHCHNLQSGTCRFASARGNLAGRLSRAVAFDPPALLKVAQCAGRRFGPLAAIDRVCASPDHRPPRRDRLPGQ